jgi:hypothetical protein
VPSRAGRLRSPVGQAASLPLLPYRNSVDGQASIAACPRWVGCPLGNAIVRRPMAELSGAFGQMVSTKGEKFASLRINPRRTATSASRCESRQQGNVPHPRRTRKSELSPATIAHHERSMETMQLTSRATIGRESRPFVWPAFAASFTGLRCGNLATRGADRRRPPC